MKNVFKRIIEFLCKAIFFIVISPIMLPVLILILVLRILEFIVNCTFNGFDDAYKTFIKGFKEDGRD